MRVALIHDWLTINGGAEKVLQALLQQYPDADVYTLVDFLPPDQRKWLDGTAIYTSFIQKLPFAKRKYTHMFPLFPYAIEQFDLSDYDLVISSSYCAAKGVIIGPHQIHISYCHSPARYAWDLQTQYLRESGLEKPSIKSFLARYFLHKFRIWDLRSSFSVDQFIANSSFIRGRINKCYRRTSEVVYPPVNLQRFSLQRQKEDYYLAASRLVPYKRIDIIVKAFLEMPEKKLKVIGSGPEEEKLKEYAKGALNIEFLGFVNDTAMVDQMSKAKAFVFAAEEDFGIIAVEAQSAGTPVIAFGKGGCLETVTPDLSGHFFYEQTPQAVRTAVLEFEARTFDPERVRSNAMQFSEESFCANINAIVERAFTEASSPANKP